MGEGDDERLYLGKIWHQTRYDEETNRYTRINHMKPRSEHWTYRQTTSPVAYKMCHRCFRVIQKDEFKDFLFRVKKTC